jgi:DNA processing protein
LLALVQLPDCGPHQIRRLLAHRDQQAAAVWQAPDAFFESHLPPKLAQTILAARQLPRFNPLDVEAMLAPYEAAGIHLIPLGAPAYPPLLAEIHNPPVLLFVQGNPQALVGKTLAVVGTRNISDYGQRVCQKLIGELAPAGPTIVSGLARGVDGAAHRQALVHQLPTVAVYGCGLDIITPVSHKGLAREILAADGACVSEYPLGVNASAYTFPQRNRIITGLSHGVLVVEGTLRSGSLISARLALEENRTVFVVPGNLFSPGAEGPHQLIRAGAVPVTAAPHILEELRWEPHRPEPLQAALPLGDTGPAAPGPTTDPILAAIGYDPTPIEAVIAKCGRPQSEVGPHLTLLELSGLIVTLPGATVRRT